MRKISKVEKFKKLIEIIKHNARVYAPSVMLAQASDPIETENRAIVPTTIGNIDDIVDIIRAVVQFILIIAFVIAFIMLLVGGIRWILAGGDEKAVAGARGTITAALIGLVIVLVAFALIRLVETFFDLDILTGGIDIPTVGTTDGGSN